MAHQPFLRYSDTPGLEIGHATHAGRSGKNNEDLYALFDTRFDGDATGFASQKVLVAVVADGIGGMAGGEMASELAIQAVAGSFSDTRRPAPQRLDEAIRRANAEIYRQAGENPLLAGMGTTVVAAIVAPDQFQVAHVGDSRAYLLRGGALHLLTLDHSWAQEAIEAGRLTPEAARTHPNRHVIRRYLGGSPDLQVDYRMVAVQPGNGAHGAAHHADDRATIQLDYAGSVERMDLLPGDTLLLCTDGLSDVVPEERIQSILAHNAPQAAADKLIAEANKNGGPDNITAILVRRSGGAAPPLARRASLLAGAGLLAALAAIAIVVYLLLGSRGGTGGNVPAEPVATAAAPDDPLAAALAAPETATATPSETPALDETATPSPTAALTGTSTPALQPAADEAALAATAAFSATVEASIAATRSATGTTTVTLTVASAAMPPGTPTRTRQPTSTPVPGEPTATATPSATVTPTATPTTTPAPPRPTSTPRPSGSQGTLVSTLTATPTAVRAPSVQGPTRLTSFSAGRGSNASYMTGDKETFSWQTDVPLAPGQVFELVFIPEGQGPDDGRSTLAASSFSSVFAPLPGQGRYTWGVWLAAGTGEDYRRIRYLDGTEGSITVTEPGSPGGGGRGSQPPAEQPTDPPAEDPKEE